MKDSLFKTQSSNKKKQLFIFIRLAEELHDVFTHFGRTTQPYLHQILRVAHLSLNDVLEFLVGELQFVILQLRTIFDLVQTRKANLVADLDYLL